MQMAAAVGEPGPLGQFAIAAGLATLPPRKTAGAFPGNEECESKSIKALKAAIG